MDPESSFVFAFVFQLHLSATTWCTHATDLEGNEICGEEAAADLSQGAQRKQRLTPFLHIIQVPAAGTSSPSEYKHLSPGH